MCFRPSTNEFLVNREENELHIKIQDPYISSARVLKIGTDAHCKPLFGKHKTSIATQFGIMLNFKDYLSRTDRTLRKVNIKLTSNSIIY